MDLLILCRLAATTISGSGFVALENAEHSHPLLVDCVQSKKYIHESDFQTFSLTFLLNYFPLIQHKKGIEGETSTRIFNIII